MRRLAYWSAPSLLLLAIYLPGLFAWFQQDDFAWLALSLDSPGHMVHTLFAPMAQGTIRPLSERGFFLLLQGLFGLWALPYRIAVFLTATGVVVLLGVIARRITGSDAAGVLAPVFWLCNAALITPMAWTSAYNQVLCTLFVLLAFYFRLRFLESEHAKWLGFEFLAFAGALGSLETAVVYPALAGVYCLFRARRLARTTVPLFVTSLVYVPVHFAVAPAASSPEYAMYFGMSPVHLLRKYWASALGISALDAYFVEIPHWLCRGASLIAGLAIAAAAVRLAFARSWMGVFGLAWFIIALAPVLPLRDHVSEYYLTLPAAGLAIAAACGFQAGWRLRGAWRWAAVVLALVYAVPGAIKGNMGSRLVAERSWRIRTVVQGVGKARHQFPGRTIVLAGVDSQLFWTGLSHDPFRVLGITDVYLAPGSDASIEQHPGQKRVSDYTVSTGNLALALENDKAVVYAVEPRRLRGATFAYEIKAREEWQQEIPSSVDVGKPEFVHQLGEGWFELEDGHRWMSKRAIVRLRGPRSASDRLYVAGWVPRQQVRKDPLRFSVSIAGKALEKQVLLQSSDPFAAVFPLPAELVGRKAVDVSVQVDRTFYVPGDKRELGLIFGTFDIRP